MSDLTNLPLGSAIWDPLKKGLGGSFQIPPSSNTYTLLNTQQNLASQWKEAKRTRKIFRESLKALLGEEVLLGFIESENLEEVKLILKWGQVVTLIKEGFDVTPVAGKEYTYYKIKL